ESQRAIFDLCWPQHWMMTYPGTVPVLVMGAERDRFFPPPAIEATARLYATEAVILPCMAHTMMLDPEWRAAADRIVEWLAAENVG
ncbi:MAG: hypothetical protein KIT18_17100, partial [Burkholderiales bacterium]|nr:hypothetical protein [Burkholderiales bacterium]